MTGDTTRAHIEIGGVLMVGHDAQDFPDPGKLLSPVFDIGPSGTQFDIPVTIGIQIGPEIALGTPLEVLRHR